MQDLLSICVDAAGGLFGTLLTLGDKQQLEQLADESLSALNNVPFEWTGLKVEKQTVFLMIDKSNPQIDTLADQWLEKNDPEAEKRRKEEEEQTEALFVTGKKKTGGETLH